MNPDQPSLPPEPDTDDFDQERRETLKKLGCYAAYTPPVVMTLLASRRALADSIIRLVRK